MTTRTEGYDIAVVGGGAAGCVVASRLAESGDRSVVLIEAGADPRPATPAAWRDGWRLPTVPDWGFTSEPDDAGATGTLRRGRLLGGTSWLTRFAVRGAAADLDAWTAAGDPGLTAAEIVAAFCRLETDVEFGNDPWHGSSGPMPITRYPALKPSGIHAAALEAFAALGFPALDDLNGPGSTGIGRVPMSSRDGVRVTTADAYLPPDRQPANLTIRPDSAVATVSIERGRAIGVRLAAGTDIRADHVILTAGTYGSPTILMRSGVGPADHLTTLGIGIEVDLPGVGSNLSDHPAVDLDTGWRGPGTTGPILHSIATLRSPIAPTNDAPDLMFWLTDPDAGDPGFWLDPILLKPASRGTVRLRSADAADAPRITLPGIREQIDHDRLADAYRLGLELANRPEIRRHATEAPPSAPTTPEAMRQRITENAYSIPHVVGTCAMGRVAQGGAVVDALGRVHGVDRLHVIDASIIPEPPSGFPHIMTIVLAELLAARIRGPI